MKIFLTLIFFTIYAPDNTLFGIQDNKILKKSFRNLDFGKFFYNQNLEVLIWDSYLNIQEPDVNLYSISPDIQELKRVKQLPVDAIKRRSCENELVKWSWVDKELKVELKSDDESKSPEYKIEVGECMDLMMEIIYNTDLIINTGEELCIFHFDLNMKSVILQYYWRIFSKNEDSFIPFNLENILFLPRTDFLKSLNSGYLSDVHELWIDTIVEDKFSLAAYGKDLMICLIYIRASFLVVIVLDKWIKWFIESPRENFYFLKIISILYSELYKSFPEHMKKFNDTLKFSLDKELWCAHLASHLEAFNRQTEVKKISLLNTKFIELFNIIFYPISLFKPLLNFVQSSRIFKIFGIKKDFYHIVLVVPLPEFTSFPKKYNPFKEFFYRPLSNPFIESCDVDIYDSWGWNGEAILNFKWDSFGKYYYYTIWFIFLIFLSCFMTISLFQDSLNEITQNSLIFAVIFLGFWHLFF